MGDTRRGGLNSTKRTSNFKMERYSDDPNARISDTRRQVEEVVDLMKNNVSIMIQREEKLSDLDARADNLEQSSARFATTSRRMKEKMWWENMKMKLCIGGTIVLIIIIIIAVESNKS